MLNGWRLRTRRCVKHYARYWVRAKRWANTKYGARARRYARQFPAPNSIGRRLLLASLVVLPLFLAATGWFFARSFETSQLSSAQERLRVQFYALVGAVEFDTAGIKVGAHIGDPRLRQLNSGLYAVIQHPRGALLWQSPSSVGIDLSPRLLATDNPPHIGKEQFETVQGTEPLSRFQYQTVWETDEGEDMPLVFTILEDQTPQRSELRAFLRELWFGLGSAAILLTLAQAVILRWGLQPLRQLAHDLIDLEQGHRGALPERYPEELQSLATNLNQLLQREQQQRERYRNTLGDLAHSLKTPLAVLRQEATRPVPDQALLEEQVQRMDQMVSYQLQRAVLSSPHGLQQRVLLRPLVDKLVGTFAKVYFEKRPQFKISVPADCECRGDEADLLELLGNLLDNACKACRGTISVATISNERWLLIAIEDDGPGIAADQRTLILQRGRRADSYAPGQGIGLAVAIDIIDTYAAELDIGSSALGGARFSIRWPA
jgi:two-component system sensor histidine kinase PhoQ